MTTGSEIRKQFIEYFAHKGHKVVRSSSLVPHDDPTLLFANAGMNQFKRVFLGEEKRVYTRAATAQKCVRAGGKHNDLENVGYTARHHTFFEMLGNFSFGDYFKEDAIRYAWDLLANVYKLPVEKLWVSVFESDDEAYNIWRDQIGVPPERILRLGEKDNFWSMGDTGPCGPCSEIHIDRGVEYGCGQAGCGVECECDRYLEIWNLVFMQFDRSQGGAMTPLPKPSIDTGMGLERLASVIQNTPTNYETDLLRPIIATVEELSGKIYGHNPGDDVSMKVIADHSRATAFLVGDGILPSNEGRGYVLRRIMRRAMRYGRQLELKEAFLFKTVASVFAVMADAYPELHENAAFIISVTQNEEERFSRTLDTGLKLLQDTLDELRVAGQTAITGAVLFKLYDTYGFPLDIVKDVIGRDGFTLDTAGFEAAMAKQKEQSRKKIVFTGMSAAYKDLDLSQDELPRFTGYTSLKAEAKVWLLVKDGRRVPEAQAGAEIELVASQTPFYAESGGQVGDSGVITGANAELAVLDTVKDPTGLIIHKCRVQRGLIREGEPIAMLVDTARRKQAAANHTATHILHAALAEILGEHVKQAGSLVEVDRLRFDFAHFTALTAAELNAVELYVNKRICDNELVDVCEMDAEQAIASGATALFGEKYGEKVRVVNVGEFSRELCGGTHAQRSGDIGCFKIVAESSVAAGVRRIEAVTGVPAMEYIQQNITALNAAAMLLKVKTPELPARIEKMQGDLKAQEREIARLKNDLSMQNAGDARAEMLEINGVKALVKLVTVEDPAQLRDMADKFKDTLQAGIVVLGAAHDGKAMLIAVVAKNLTDKYHAGNIIKAVAQKVDGRGGGRPDMAQAGGSQPQNLAAALAYAKELIEKTYHAV